MMTKINADNLKYLTLMQKKAAILMLERGLPQSHWL